MAPTTRSAAPSSSSPLFQRMKAELKRDNEKNGKKRREAVPETLRASIRKTNASIKAANTVAAPGPAATKSTETSESHVATASSSRPVNRATSSTKRKYKTIEDEETKVATQQKKQKNAHCATGSSVKRKCAGEKVIDDNDDIFVPARAIKKLRTAPAARDNVLVRESTATAAAAVATTTTTTTTISTPSALAKRAQAARNIKPRTAALGAATLSILKAFNGPEDIRSVETGSSNGLDEVTVSGDGFFVRVLSHSDNDIGEGPTTSTNSVFDKNVTKGKRAVNATARPAKKEEIRKGEKEAWARRMQQEKEEIKGEMEKEKESKGKIVIRSSPASSLQLSKTTSITKTSTINVYEVEDDYNTDDVLSDSDSDSDNLDYDTTPSDTESSTPPCDDPLLEFLRGLKGRNASTRSRVTSRAAITEMSDSDSDDDDDSCDENDDEDDDEEDNEEDSIPTICTEGIRRDEAGLPSAEEEDEAKGQKKPILEEFMDYGNGAVSYLMLTEERKIKTAAEKKKMTALEKRNDRMMDMFFSAVEADKKAMVNRAMRDYKAGKSTARKSQPARRTIASK